MLANIKKFEKKEKVNNGACGNGDVQKNRKDISFKTVLPGYGRA